MFEGLKGTLVFIAGFGLLSLVHHDVQATAEQIVRHLHLNPARHFPRIFIEAAGHIDDTRLMSLAAFAGVYGLVRFIEAWGLWHKRAWAEWFAIISGSIYLPIEVYEIWEHTTGMRVIVFLVNAVIVGYLVYVRLLSKPNEHTHRT
jgi:uncharacterized membrane protein (DUF2068 family)